MRDIVERAGPALDRLDGASLVITGAGGMLARYMVETVAYCNRERFRSPCRLTAVVRRTPSDAIEAPGVEYRIHDARRAFEEAADGGYLVLAATRGAPSGYMAEPVETLELNGPGVFAWLEWAHRSRCQSVLYFSSGEIYGSAETNSGGTPEDYAGRLDPALARSVYAESKRYGEAVCMALHRSHGLPVRVVRPFQVFGPGIRDSDTRAMSSFLREAAAGRPIRLQSAGQALRTYLYIADAAVAFWKVLLEGAPGRAYNVGAPGPEVTVLDLAQRIRARTGCQLEVGGAASDAPARTCPDISRISNELGFAPRYGLDELIDRTLIWMNEEERC
ncbi:MAG: NAD-dependent epimerase/dehydratase family protein [Bryobacteraceae bacterium]